MRLGYEIRREGEILVTGATEHAFTDTAGRVLKPPPDVRQAFAALAMPEGD
jgi:acyl-CoA thioesterase FadM